MILKLNLLDFDIDFEFLQLSLYISRTPSTRGGERCRLMTMKYIFILFLLFVSVTSYVPLAHAQAFECNAKTQQCAPDVAGKFADLKSCERACDPSKNALCARGFEPACNFTSICKTYGFVINTATMVAGLFALAMGIYGSFKYMTANGVTEELTNAQTMIVNAMIGLVIVVVAYSITRIILTVTDVGTICF